MARPIWSGTLSFGLLNIPVSLMSGERKTDISFRMLDSRNNQPIRYERVNAETGEEVAWKDIVKAFEYDKGSYVVLEPDDIKSAAPESHDAIEVEAFVDVAAIGPQYFEKPYVLVPAKKAEKGYVLLREALAKTGRIGIARVVIRTRESLCAVMPQDNALLLMMMRYPQELVDIDEYRIPEGKSSEYRITDKELEFSEQLIQTMSGEWEPEQYRDEFRQRLQDVITRRMKDKGVVKHGDEEPPVHEHAATNVVDFMELLQQSIARKQRTPAKKAGKAADDDGKDAKPKKAAKKTAKKAASKKPAAKKTAAKKKASGRKAA
ncbi:DNA-binding protein [Lysobacter arseniciresistens ZS79]|uniref:Non-homologous end joining protein Ku n=1 Tax=Lysobacter arseniciresistens ZS79 TaxID=913325 RepID=A0A0A0EUI9_9GAMM|nr:Ku protein [Lysobacter arseniciresistens]KGM54606.1 DNA-binding protein [Lysobacter arseniciresistens ZS79]